MTVTERATPWDPAARHRFVTSDGTALHVEDTGQAGGATVLLAHGWTLDHTSWDRVVAALPGTRTTRYDHRGHGGSAPSPRGTATIEQAADDLAELITARIPDGPIVLVGHSMGGMTAMALAQRHAELFAARIAGVALVATSSGGLAEATLGLPNWLGRRVAGGERRINKRLGSANRSQLLRNPRIAAPGLRWLLFGKRPRTPDVRATATQVARCHPASMAAFRASINEHERRAALAAFRDIPVVIAVGGRDRLTPLPHARRIAAELPSARLAIYPGAGHMLPYERDVDIAAHIAQLVARVRA
jgi:pimeloyl-ACP methyl ester carboxylesterase